MDLLWANDSGGSNEAVWTDRGSRNETEDTIYGDNTDLRSLLLVIFNGWGLTLVSVVGIVLNLLSILVFLQPRMRRRSINFLLLCLQISDLLYLCTIMLLTGLYVLLLKYARDFVIAEFENVFQHAFPYVVTLETLALCGSHYFTIVVSLERYVAVCHPLMVRVICTPKRAMLASICVATFSILFSLTRWFIFDIVDLTSEAFYLWMVLLTIQIVPFVALVILNTAIYIGHRRSQREVRSVGSISEEESSLTLLLLSIVLVYLLCNSLYVVYNISVIFSGAIRNEVYVPRNFFLALNSACNFIFYCAFGKKFRTELKKVFQCNWCGTSRNGTLRGNARTLV